MSKSAGSISFGVGRAPLALPLAIDEEALT